MIVDAQVLSAKAKLTTGTDISLCCNSTLNRRKQSHTKIRLRKTCPKNWFPFLFFFFQFNVTTSNLRFSWSWWLGNKRDEWYRANYQPLKFHFIDAQCNLIHTPTNMFNRQSLCIEKIMHSIYIMCASLSIIHGDDVYTSSLFLKGGMGHTVIIRFVLIHSPVSCEEKELKSTCTMKRTDWDWLKPSYPFLAAAIAINFNCSSIPRKLHRNWFQIDTILLAIL